MSLVRTTPKAQNVTAPLIATPSPGNWRHPRFDEITRRKNASTFDEENMRKLLWNGGALLLSWILARLMDSYPQLASLIQPSLVHQVHYIIHWLLRLLFIFNMAVSCYPLVKPKDNITDIPLTPSQRALLGLDPYAAPLDTPLSECITPPRYPRMSTPRSASPASRGSNSTRSASSLNVSPSFGREGSESPFSASASSIWQKSVGGSRDSLRRSSFGSPSLGVNSMDLTAAVTPSTPSPVGGRSPSVPLNNRWLYNRGRVAPGSRGPKIY